MRRPQSRRKTICWSRSSWYSREIRRRRRAVRLPVDLAQRVALAVVAQLVELEALAAAALLQHADLREPVVGREERVVGERGEIGIDAHRLRGSNAHAAVPEPERRAHAHLRRCEAERRRAPWRASCRAPSRSRVRARVTCSGSPADLASRRDGGRAPRSEPANGPGFADAQRCSRASGRWAREPGTRRSSARRGGSARAAARSASGGHGNDADGHEPRVGEAGPDRRSDRDEQQRHAEGQREPRRNRPSRARERAGGACVLTGAAPRRDCSRSPRMESASRPSISSSGDDRDAVAQDGERHLLHVVGRDEVAAFGERSGARRAHQRDARRAARRRARAPA